MKHTISAVIALALGIGLATAAQAHGNYRQSALPNGSAQAGTAATGMQQSIAPRQMRQSRIARQMTPQRREVRQLQLALKQDGLYRGKVTGTMNRPTRLALSRFEKQNGLPQTARVNKRLLARLEGGRNTGNQAVGVGSSTPRNGNQAGAANMNQTMPRATTTPNAGGNTGSTIPSNDQNTNNTPPQNK